MERGHENNPFFVPSAFFARFVVIFRLTGEATRAE